MKFNPAFLKVGRTLSEADDYGISKDSEESSNLTLGLVPNEVYNQFIVVDDNMMHILTSPITGVILTDEEGKELPEVLAHGYKVFVQHNCIFISFKIRNDYGNKCIRLSLKFDIGSDTGQGDFLTTAPFKCSEMFREITTLVTYRHLSNHYSIPYNIPVEGEDILWNQMRLPLTYLRMKTEQDSEENIYDTDKPSNISISRVQRRDVQVWRVIANDWINQRLAIVSDSDYVYFDSFRQVTRPYVWEELEGGKNFSISELESQMVYGDTFMDNSGMVHYLIVIDDVLFPDGDCCDPGEDPPIEPVLISESIVTPSCTTTYGYARKIFMTGVPNSTAKLRVDITGFAGAVKGLEVNGVMYNFSGVGQFQEIFYYFNGDGNSEITFHTCFEACTPSALQKLDFTVRFYKYNMTVFTGDISHFNLSHQCPTPSTAKWEVITNTSSSKKTVRVIEGVPSGIAEVKAEVLLLEGTPPPISFVKFGNLIESYNITPGQEWLISFPLDPTGNSASFVVEVMNPGTPSPFNPSFISVKFTILDSLGGMSSEILTFFRGMA